MVGAYEKRPAKLPGIHEMPEKPKGQVRSVY